MGYVTGVIWDSILTIMIDRLCDVTDVICIGSIRCFLRDRFPRGTVTAQAELAREEVT